MIKPPVVQAVGTMRALRLAITDESLYYALRDMGQLPVLPADGRRVGGRYRLAQHEHGARPVRDGEPDADAELRGAARQGARGRARRDPGAGVRRGRTRPWARPGSRRGSVSSLRYYADNARAVTANDRIARQRVLRALHARRPRRSGDVMTDEPPRPDHRPRGRRGHPLRRLRALGQPGARPRPGQRDADHRRGRGGLPRRRPAGAGHGPPQLPAHRRHRHGVGVRRGAHRLDARLRGGRRRGRRTRQPARDDLPQRRQRRPQHHRARRRARHLRREAPGAGAGARPLGRRPRSAPRSCRGRAARTPGPTSACPASATTATRKGFDTLWGDGSGGPGSDLAVWPGRRLHPGQPLPLRQPRLLVRRRAAEDGDGLARPLARPLRVAGQPAAGRLARLEHLQADPHRQGAGQRGPQPQRRRVPRGRRLDRPRRTPRSRWRRCRWCPPGPATPSSPRPARCSAARCRCRARCARWPAPPRAPATRSRTSPSGCSSRRPCCRPNLGTRVVTIDWGSFDTHGNQLASQDPQLSTLSRALAAFKADLTARGIEQRVVTVVFSEFGRRVESNESGTDHGAGGLMMAMGSSVRGGMRGEFPGLGHARPRRPARDHRLPRASTRRSIADWLGGDPAAVIPGGPFGLGRAPDRMSRPRPASRPRSWRRCRWLTAPRPRSAAPRLHRTTLPPPDGAAHLARRRRGRVDACARPSAWWPRAR